MNELIEKLAEQANVTYHHETGDAYTVFDKEKFAELIVRECISLMEQEKKYYSDPGAYEPQSYYDRCAAKAEAFDNAVDKISYHFGVK